MLGCAHLQQAPDPSAEEREREREEQKKDAFN